MRDFSLVHIGTEVRERKGDFNKIVSLMLDSTYYDALEERNELSITSEKTKICSAILRMKK
ncbi:hypothetical protein [Priestia megaterium]|jgi:hypothetical protein|uniref:hypothetical protein n=1 Tax=Priestia megaterium TaxID=1404 RepID=UPI00203FD848|nr:hypothetical protein [Priestia megaterium]MCM3544267.1 hypothetical protein [Priestia megaterium]